jgi:hypothetical protein
VVDEHRIELHCPKCGGIILESPASRDLKSALTCGGCGHSGCLGDFKTSSGQTLRQMLFERAADLAPEMFKETPGSRPIR